MTNLDDIKQRVKEWELQLKTSPITPDDVRWLIERLEEMQAETRRLADLLIDARAESLQSQMMESVERRRL
jgi:hypothetical protein